MEEIKVGEYVRTEEGNIGKIEQINKEPTEVNVVYAVTDNWVGMYEEIINHSEDIADLIGYGDFINGKMCIDIEHYTRDDGTKGINFVCIGGSVLKENIRNVMTKEQFNQVKYEV